MPLRRSHRAIAGERRGTAAPARRSRVALVAILGVALGAGCVEKATEHRVRANAFLRGGDAAAALTECDQGLARKKDDAGLLILRGKALFELERYPESRESYERALEAGKGDDARSLSEAHLGLGMVGSRQKDWALARAEFEALAKINDKGEYRDASSHTNIARACLQLGDMPCAIEHAETAGRARGNDEAVLYTLGTIYLAAGKSDEAERTFRHICEVVPGAASCPYGVALVAAKAGDKARALEQLKEAVGRKLPNPDQMATDPAFASLRDDPEFEALAAQAAAK